MLLHHFSSTEQGQTLSKDLCIVALPRRRCREEREMLKCNCSFCVCAGGPRTSPSKKSALQQDSLVQNGYPKMTNFVSTTSTTALAVPSPDGFAACGKKQGLLSPFGLLYSVPPPPTHKSLIPFFPHPLFIWRNNNNN